MSGIAITFLCVWFWGAGFMVGCFIGYRLRMKAEDYIKGSTPNTKTKHQNMR